MTAGIMLALLTSCCWALANVYIQRATLVMGTVRALFFAVLVGAVAAAGASVLLEGPRGPVDGATFAFAALAVVAGLVGYLGMFYAFEKALLSVAVPLVSGWSLISAAFSLLVLGERVTVVQLGGAGVVFAGVLCVAYGATRGPETGLRRAAGWPLAAAVAGAIGFGVMIPAVGQVAPRLGALGTTAIVYLSFAVLGVPLARALRLPLTKPPAGRWGLVLVSGVAETAGLAAVALAPRFAPMTVVAPLSSLAATFTVLYAWFVLRERQNRLVVLGSALVCAGVVALAIPGGV